ncbi:MAG TPA: serine/threonine-protein kinase [Ktedonobacterales bacterium]|nr:serine/threonine-protein kinase [Ktedonobacterales bacterium]
MNDDLIGVTLGHCTLEEFLGQGGMARVYRGKQANLDRYVAIKVLPPYYAADPAFVERFKLEAKAMARLSHPNIVTVHDAGEENGRLFIVMEYIVGGTLKDRMRSAMTLREITRIVHEVAGALTYAHAQGVVHRDVKPVNVLMDTTAGRAVLSDFGIAKVLATSAAITHAGAGVGTPEYMSPEQCRGGATVDARSDIYALGVMLYELLTGRTPFVADNYTALAHAHIYEAPPPPSQLNPRISPAVQSVILKALEKNPADRFQKATELAGALEQAVAAQTPVQVSSQRKSAPPAPGAGSAQAPGALLCPRCHQPNAAQMRFCSACGEQLAAGPPAPSAAYQQPGDSWINCPQCHAPNPSINRFCTSCGYTLMPGVAGFTCRVCGQRNPAGKRFCTGCGAPLRP